MIMEECVLLVPRIMRRMSRGGQMKKGRNGIDSSSNEPGYEELPHLCEIRSAYRLSIVFSQQEIAGT